MKKLLELEYLKIKNFTVFKAFMLLFMVVVPLLFYSIGGLSSPFQAGKESFLDFQIVGHTSCILVVGVCYFLPYWS